MLVRVSLDRRLWGYDGPAWTLFKGDKPDVIRWTLIKVYYFSSRGRRFESIFEIANKQFDGFERNYELVFERFGKTCVSAAIIFLYDVTNLVLHAFFHEAVPAYFLARLSCVLPIMSCSSVFSSIMVLICLHDTLHDSQVPSCCLRLRL